MYHSHHHHHHFYHHHDKTQKEFINKKEKQEQGAVVWHTTPELQPQLCFKKICGGMSFALWLFVLHEGINVNKYEISGNLCTV